MGSYYAGVINSKYDSELKHFGILGQKWGIRRFQNPDGSLTTAGRERYRKSAGSGIDSKRMDSAVSNMLKKNKGNLYKDVFKREEAVEEASKITADKRMIQKVADDIALEYEKAKYEKATGRKYDELLKSTDFSSLSKDEKLKNELEILKLNDDDVDHERFSKSPKVDAYYDLGDRIMCESGDWYRSQPVTRAFEKANKKCQEFYRKLNNYSQKHLYDAEPYYRTEEYKKLRDDYLHYREEVVPSVVLKDLGYEDTPESRRLIEPMIFWD